MHQRTFNPTALATALVAAGMAVCCAAPQARGDAYGHESWYRERGRTLGQTEIQFDKDRFIEYKYPAEQFALKSVDMWSVGSDEPGWLTNFTRNVHGGMKITPLPAESKVTLDSASRSYMDAIRKRLKAEGGSLISINSTPAKFCGFPGKRIEQKFTFRDLPDPIICVSHIAIGNNAEYRLELAVFEKLYKDKTYRAMLDDSVASAHPLGKAIRNTKLPMTDAELDSMIAQVLSQLKEKNDRRWKVVFKYPSNWATRIPADTSAEETVVLFNSPKDLVKGAMIAKKLFPEYTPASLAKEYIDHFATWPSKLDYTVLKNEPVKFGGHDAVHIQVREAQHYDYTSPFVLHNKYIAIANGKVYDLEINAPEAAYPKLQKFVDAVLNSIKF